MSYTQPQSLNSSPLQFHFTQQDYAKLNNVFYAFEGNVIPFLDLVLTNSSDRVLQFGIADELMDQYNHASLKANSVFYLQFPVGIIHLPDNLDRSNLDHALLDSYSRAIIKKSHLFGSDWAICYLPEGDHDNFYFCRRAATQIEPHESTSLTLKYLLGANTTTDIRTRVTLINGGKLLSSTDSNQVEGRVSKPLLVLPNKAATYIHPLGFQLTTQDRLELENTLYLEHPQLTSPGIALKITNHTQQELEFLVPSDTFDHYDANSLAENSAFYIQIPQGILSFPEELNRQHPQPEILDRISQSLVSAEHRDWRVRYLPQEEKDCFYFYPTQNAHTLGGGNTSTIVLNNFTGKLKKAAEIQLTYGGLARYTDEAFGALSIAGRSCSIILHILPNDGEEIFENPLTFSLSPLSVQSENALSSFQVTITNRSHYDISLSPSSESIDYYNVDALRTHSNFSVHIPSGVIKLPEDLNRNNPSSSLLDSISQTLSTHAHWTIRYLPEIIDGSVVDSFYFFCQTSRTLKANSSALLRIKNIFGQHQTSEPIPVQIIYRGVTHYREGVTRMISPRGQALPTTLTVLNTSNVSNPLAIPMYIGALFLKQNQNVVCQLANHENLPYRSPNGTDYSNAIPYISGTSASQAFEAPSLLLYSGIHLHWFLPPGFTGGQGDSQEGLVFPAVPNRWLIMRRGGGKADKQWVVESDYLYPQDDFQLDSNTINIFYPTEGQNYYPYRYMGRQWELSSWLSSKNSTKQYLSKLTALGEYTVAPPDCLDIHQLIFSAYYPNCHSVFGFRDSDYANTNPPNNLTYDVVGWYSDGTQDYLYEFLQEHLGSDTDTILEHLQQEASWNVTLQSGQSVPQQSICFGRITFASGGGTPNDTRDGLVTPQIAIGNSPAEALSAYLAYQYDSDNSPTGAEIRSKIEDQLMAIQLLNLMGTSRLDTGTLYQKTRHEQEFTSTNGGYLWQIVPPTSNNNGQNQITLPDNLAAQLNALNQAQEAYDQASNKIAALREQLYSDWYKYMIDNYTTSNDPDNNLPDHNAIRGYVDSEVTKPLTDAMQDTGIVTINSANAQGNMSVSVTHFPGATDSSSNLAHQVYNAAQAVLNSLRETNWTLQATSPSQFWQPNDPVVLMAGDAVASPLSNSLDQTVNCQVLTGTLNLSDIPSSTLNTLKSYIDRYATANGVGVGNCRWTQQPWYPMLLDWQAQLYPLKRLEVPRKSLLLPGTSGNYGRIPHHDAINFAAHSDFTIEACIFFNTSQPSGDRSILEKYDGHGGYPFMIRFLSNNTIRVGRSDGTHSPSITTASYDLVQDYKNHYIAFVKRGNKLSLYLDDRLINEIIDTTTGNTQNNSPLYLGCRNGNSDYFNGRLSQIKIWNYARSFGEIHNSQYYYIVGDEPGLLGYWPCDEDGGSFIFDRTSLENHGTLSGTVNRYTTTSFPTVEGNDLSPDCNHPYDTNSIEDNYDLAVNSLDLTPRNQFSEPGLEISGNNTYISIPNVSETGDFTVEFWLYPYSVTSYNQWIAAGRGWGSFAFHVNSDGKIYVGINSGDNQRLSTEIPNNTVQRNTWQHFAFVYTANNQLGILYKNGQRIAAKANLGTPLAWNGFSIGRNDSGTVNGQIGEVRVWGCARSNIQIRENMYIHLTGNEPHLSGYWTFGEPSGTIIQDRTPHNNDGTLHGSSFRRLTMNVEVHNLMNSLVDTAEQFSGTSLMTPDVMPLMKDQLKSYINLKVMPDYYTANSVPSDQQNEDYITNHLNTVFSWYCTNHHLSSSPSAGNVNDPNYTALWAYQQLQTLKCLAQSLKGFNDALLSFHQGFQLDIKDPLAFSNQKPFYDKVRNALNNSRRPGDRIRSPLISNSFNPIRAGGLRITGLRLIDVFGRVKPVVDPEDNDTFIRVVTPTSMIPVSGRPYQVWLPPRLCQSARLDFRWLAADNDALEMNQHPATTPICGWIWPNNLDNNVIVYDNQGAALGIIDQNAHWQAIPGNSLVNISSISNRHLQQVINYLTAQGAAFLQDFITAIETGTITIDPENFQQNLSLALLMGRPLAIVRAKVNIELLGTPAINQMAGALQNDMQPYLADDDDKYVYYRQTNNFTGVKFPVRIGEYQQLNDGLVGYWVENSNGTYQNNKFYAPQSNYVPNANIDTLFTGIDDRTNHPLNLTQTLEPNTAQTLTLIIDPRCKVHATCGLVPPVDIEIPPDQFASVLQNLNIVFQAMPIVSDDLGSLVSFTSNANNQGNQNSIHLSLPAQTGFSWSWTSSEGSQWATLNELDDFEKNPTFITQKIYEGWVKLTPDSDS